MNAYRIIRTFGIVALVVAGFVQCSKIEEGMTDYEKTNLSRKTRDKNVEPVEDYRYNRSAVNLRRTFSNYGKTIESYLKSSDGQLIGANTPVWVAFTTSNRTVEYRKLPEGIVGRAVSTFLAQHRNYSEFAGNEPQGKNFLFPESVQPSRMRREVPDASRTVADAHDDKFFNSRPSTQAKIMRRLTEPMLEESDKRTDASRVKRSDKEIIYPSLLVQTYYKGAKTSRDEVNYTDEIIYQLAFWNAVDLRFRQASNPEIRIHVSGIIIGLDQNAIPYQRSDVVDVVKIWEEAQKYWYTMSQREDFPGKAYDIVVTITDSHLHRSTGDLRPGAIAAQTTCNHSLATRFHSVAIVRDKGAFEGISTATQALGHFLGANYHTTNGECQTWEGFIMEPELKVGPNNLKFAPCSLRRLSTWLRMPHINCFDTPAEFYPSGDPVKKLLPGDVQDSHKQCQARGYDRACESQDTCLQLQCYHTGDRAAADGSSCHYTVPATEGTRCALGHQCIEGLCQCMTADCLYIE